MNTYRKTAIIVGVLYITATVAYSIGIYLIGAIADAPDYLVKFSENENQVIIGALLVLIDAVAVAGIAIAMHPVLKKYNDAVALGYVGARLAEGILFIVNVITILTLLSLSREFIQAETPDASYFHTLGELLIAAGDWAFMLGFGLAFTLSALILNYVLFQSKLIPRWLSAWGFVGAVMVLTYYLVKYFSSNQVDILFIPIAVQEMVFAVWLIAKGFNKSAIATLSAK
jgi:hypothetical protein